MVAATRREYLMSEDTKPTCEGGCGPYRLERMWFGDMLVCERCDQVEIPDAVPVEQHPEATP